MSVQLLGYALIDNFDHCFKHEVHVHQHQYSAKGETNEFVNVESWPVGVFIEREPTDQTHMDNRAHFGNPLRLARERSKNNLSSNHDGHTRDQHGLGHGTVLPVVNVKQ